MMLCDLLYANYTFSPVPTNIWISCFRQLPSETKLFNVVDKNWKDIMRRVIDNPNALKSATAAGNCTIYEIIIYLDVLTLSLRTRGGSRHLGDRCRWGGLGATAPEFFCDHALQTLGKHEQRPFINIWSKI